QDRPKEVFTGYRGVRVIADEGSLRGRGVRQGDSYRVLSAHPKHSLEGLRESPAGWAGSSYVRLPPDSDRLRELARQITAGASSDFGKVERIVSYLGQQDNFDPHRPGDLVSYASLEEFLFEDEPGSALDYATATVMLARASGVPSRLALGYLPGVRDPLSGAYMVREQDAHAWAEVYFEDQGWVPIDTAPRPDITLLFNDDTGVGYLFQQGFGEKAYSAVKGAPSRLADLISNLSFDPVVSGIGGVVALIVFGLRWWYTRSHSGPPRDGRLVWLRYSPLPGDGRRELLKVYGQVEKLLGRRGLGPRQPWETVTEYTATTAETPDVERQLSWFTRTVWRAAYNPGDFPAVLVTEAKQRLALLKRALKASDRAAA
ncbi:MAG: transglutaminase family protein, partial [Dehalococcoidia bacterium]